MNRFLLQQQPDDKTCMCTCLAMLIGESAEYIIGKYHQHMYDDRSTWFDDVFDEIGIEYRYGHPKNGAINWGEAALLTVGSLNFEGTMHQILVWAEDGKFYVADPQAGKDGRKYYVAHEPQDDMQVQLSGWRLDIAIPLNQKFFEDAA